MGVSSNRTTALSEALRALDSCEPTLAAQAFLRYRARRGLGRVREPLVRLLHRRGYFVRTPEELAASIEEIRQTGTGFDLYELLAAIASCDEGPRPEFPELRPFSRAETP